MRMCFVPDHECWKQAELVALRAENTTLQEKLRRLEGIEECIMDHESHDYEQAMELEALKAELVPLRALREAVALVRDTDRINERLAHASDYRGLLCVLFDSLAECEKVKHA